MGFGLYLHIPYCLAKCRYCDFYSAGASRGVPDEYVDALIARMAAMCPGRPETVYFGRRHPQPALPRPGIPAGEGRRPAARRGGHPGGKPRNGGRKKSWRAFAPQAWAG